MVWWFGWLVDFDLMVDDVLVGLFGIFVFNLYYKLLDWLCCLWVLVTCVWFVGLFEVGCVCLFVWVGFMVSFLCVWVLWLGFVVGFCFLDFGCWLFGLLCLVVVCFLFCFVVEVVFWVVVFCWCVMLGGFGYWCLIWCGVLFVGWAVCWLVYLISLFVNLYYKLLG